MNKLSVGTKQVTNRGVSLWYTQGFAGHKERNNQPNAKTGRRHNEAFHRRVYSNGHLTWETIFKLVRTMQIKIRIRYHFRHTILEGKYLTIKMQKKGTHRDG